jgi:hypothetical protein
MAKPLTQNVKKPIITDIEHNETVLNFYLKNGFIPNEETSNKRRKTISMRRDILFRAKA